jgi:hypothetical protein
MISLNSNKEILFSLSSHSQYYVTMDDSLSTPHPLMNLSAYQDSFKAALLSNLSPLSISEATSEILATSS